MRKKKSTHSQDMRNQHSAKRMISTAKIHRASKWVWNRIEQEASGSSPNGSSDGRCSLLRSSQRGNGGRVGRFEKLLSRLPALSASRAAQTAKGVTVARDASSPKAPRFAR